MIKKRRKHRDIDCRICQNGCRRFAENLVEPRITSRNKVASPRLKNERPEEAEVAFIGFDGSKTAKRISEGRRAKILGHRLASTHTFMKEATR